MRTILTILLLNCSLTGIGQLDTLEVLSWNVFLRPSILRDGQMDRVDSISNYLLESDADIIILQEVFHRRASKALRAKLRATYPNQTKRGPKTLFGVPSGVVILSKEYLPFRKTRHVSFKHAAGSDQFARKGFVRARIKYRRHRIDLIGTHLQAGGGIKRNRIRMWQLNHIKNEVDQSDTSIQIYAGDFNIDENSNYMDSLQNKLNVNCAPPESANRFTANFSDHELYEANGDPKWIDFILTEKTEEIFQLWCEIECPKQIINGVEERLSDHNPVIGKIVLNH